MSEVVAIYALFDPREPLAIRYVGKTQQSLAQRLGAHIREARTGAQSYRYKWIRFVLADGVRPEIRLLESVVAESWQERERDWIARLRAAKHPLTNGSSGGGGLESAAWKAVWADPQRRARQSAALAAHNADPAVREKKSNDGKRRYADPDERQRTARQQQALAAVPAIRQQRSVSTRASWQDPVKRARRMAAIRKYHSTDAARVSKSASAKRAWNTRKNKARSELCTSFP